MEVIGGKKLGFSGKLHRLSHSSINMLQRLEYVLMATAVWIAD